jgi:hypothetical protein
LFSGVNSLFGGGVRSVASVGVAGAVVAPATAGAGTPIGLPSGGTGIVSATGTVQPVTSTAGNVAYGAGGNVAIAGGGGPGLPGGGFFSGFFGPSVSVYDAAIAYQAAGFQGVAALQSGQAVVVGGEFISTTVGGYGAAELGAIGADAFAVAPSAAQGAGLVASQAFSFVGGVVGVGLSAYSAFQAGRSGDKYAALTGAASGAASGALAGSAIFPGIGTAIGAIAGAAIGAGAGAAGKSKSKGKSHAQREAKELKRVAQSVEGFESRVASATTLEDLYDALLEYTPASYGGEKGRLDPQTSDPAILLDRYRRGEISFAEMDRFINASDRGPGRAGFVFTFVHEGDRHAVARTDPWRGQHLSMRIANRDVFVEWGIGGDIETFVARIQAGVAEDQLAQINDAATVAVQRKVAELRQAEIGALLAFEDTFDAPGVPGTTVSRLTSFPQVRVDEVGARGRDLLFSTDQGALAGLTDDQIEALIRRIARVDRDRNLGAIDAEHLIF